MRGLGAASDRRSSCPGPKVSIQIAVFLALLRLGHAGLMHAFMRMRSLPRAQGLHPNCGVFGPIGVGACGAQACLYAGLRHAFMRGSGMPLCGAQACLYAGLMHGFMRMRSLLRAQGLHPNSGVFGPVTVGACAY